MRGIAALMASIVFTSVSAQACNVEQFLIQNFSSEIDQWSDGSGNVVRLTGDLRSACRQAASVTLLIEAKGKSGGTIGQAQTVLNIMPGGMPFDLAGKIPYDPNAASYEVSIVRVR